MRIYDIKDAIESVSVHIELKDAMKSVSVHIELNSVRMLNL